MPIYWTFFATPLVLKFIHMVGHNSILFRDEEKNEKRIVVILFVIIIFFAGMRSYVSDTHIYANTYKSLPVNLSDFNADTYERDWMFYYLSTLFKIMTKGSYNAWFMVIAVISGYFFGRVIYRYSEEKWLSCYLFVAGCMFSWFFNGMRQFIVMSVLFGNIDLVLNKKLFKFVLLVILMGQIHGSSYFFLIILLLERCEPWSKVMWWIILLSIIVGMGFNSFSEVMDNVLENTQYSGMGTTMANGSGSSPIRVLFAAFPVILSWIMKDKINKQNSSILNLCVNASIMNMASMIISTFSFGIYMGRVAAYFNMFNIILLPWLIMNLYEGKNKQLIILGFLLLYAFYFIYQMEIAWRGWPYVSEVLNLKFMGRNKMTGVV